MRLSRRGHELEEQCENICGFRELNDFAVCVEFGSRKRACGCFQVFAMQMKQKTVRGSNYEVCAIGFGNWSKAVERWVNICHVELCHIGKFNSTHILRVFYLDVKVVRVPP